MEVVLPFRIKNEKKFFECAFKLGFDEMSAQKLFYITHQSDLDIFPRMGDERLNMVLYCWEMCEDYKMKLDQDEWELPEELEAMLKILVPWSLDVWFSKEWDRCKLLLKHSLIHCLNRARGLLMRLPDMMQINWDFLLLYNLTPWQVTYLKSLNVTKEKTLENGALTIETEEQMASPEDMAYLKLEQLPLIVLRLVKLFDQSSIDMVKTLCMRVIAAWNKLYCTELQTGGLSLPYVLPEDKRCLLLICHIYLMAVYETDDAKGYVIDNMINNVRFYYQGFQTSYAMDSMKYTPARFIALTCIHLRLQKREFFDSFIWNSYDTSQVKLFGVVSQAYKSYLLGNLLMELNHMNEEDFAANVALYKRLMNSYVNEREKSEIFMLNELQKQEAQHYAHNIIQCVQNMTDFKSKICKGNRMSNIGNYENTDDTTNSVGEVEENDVVEKKEDELRVDPIFQNVPNNQDILYYVYDVLSKKSYTGWHFPKIILLFKIISHELNMIETWRYHPGLTINFMLNLEMKLSQHYTDLAKIFIDHPFIEQEFWLTAFYLNPTNYNYEAIKRLGIRINRKRSDDQGRWVTGKDKIDAKYGLLSSTIDVKEITNLSNTEERSRDYEPLFKALCSLNLPDCMVKDILTVVFLPRNKSFSWAVDWGDLRRRCKMLISNSNEKKRFVELNMAEANDRLKFLKIDYEKYKNRPQLDYGSIEQGYENLMNSTDMEDDSEEESEEEDFEDDEDVYETQKGRGIKKQAETIEDDNSQEEDPYLMGKRRTRARAAAAMASLLFNSDLATRRKRRKKDEEETPKENEDGDGEDKSNDSKSAETTESLTPSAMEEGNSNSTMSDIPKKNMKECLKERPVYANPTYGFQPLIDMWNIEKSELEKIDISCLSLYEYSSILHRFAKFKNTNKVINPLASNDVELKDNMELVITQHMVKTGKESDAPVFKLPVKNIRIKEEPAESQVLAEKAKSVDSQDTEQMSQQDNNVAQVNSPSNDQQNTEDADYLNPKSNSGNKRVAEVEDTISDEQDIHTMETSTEKIDGETSITYEDDMEPQEEGNKVMSQNENEEAIDDQQVINENETTEEKESNANRDNEETIDDQLVRNELQITASQEDQIHEQEYQNTNKINTVEGNDNAKGIKNDEKEDTTIVEKQLLDAMEINVEKDHKVSKHICRNESASPITDKLDEAKCLEFSVSNQENQNSYIADNQENNNICINDSEENDIEMSEQIENDATTTVVENQESNPMEKHDEQEKEITMPEPNEGLTSMSHQNEGSGTISDEKGRGTPIAEKHKTSETEITIRQETDNNISEPNDEQLESTAVELLVIDSEEKESTIVDEQDHSTSPPSDDKLKSNQVEIDPEETDKLLQLTMDSKIEAILGTVDADEPKLKENTFSLMASPTPQTTLEEKLPKVQENIEENNDTEMSNIIEVENTVSLEIKIMDPTELLDINDMEATESLKIQKKENDDHIITQSAEVKSMPIDEDKSIRYIQSIDNVDKFDVISNETETIKPETTLEDLHIKTHGCDMPLLDSEESNSAGEQKVKDSNLKKLCLTKPLKVLMRKLRPSDLINLRQPKVRLKRIKNIGVFLEKTRVKRKRFKTKVYLDESSDTSILSNSSSSEPYRPPKSRTRTRRQVQNRTSDSECDSTKSNHNMQKRSLSSSNPSSNQSNNTTRSSSRPTAASNLVVTPRSASGLKLRISHADQKPKKLQGKSNVRPVDEIIQLSSSSNDSNTMDSIAEVVEIPDDGDIGDPLFEEEMVIIRPKKNSIPFQSEK